MAENISLVVSTQQLQQQPQQQQQPQSAQAKPRPLGRVRVQGQRAGLSGPRKSEDFSVQGEAYSSVEKPTPPPPAVSTSSSSSSLPPITGGQQSPQQLRQSSVQSSSGSPPSDAGRLARLQQREQELLKKLLDASSREKLLREQVDRLEKTLAATQQLLEGERLARQDLETELTQASGSGDKYRRLFEEECRAHDATKQRAEQLQEQHRTETARLLAQVNEAKAELAQLTARHEEQLAQLGREHQEAVADRDKRIDNLKRQVAAALGTNSHERQSQIDQLNRELQKMVEEVESLRKRGGCQQCPKKDAAIKDQGELIRQLRLICQRFRGQLGEQEQMLVMLLDGKNSASAAAPTAPKAKR